MKTDSILKQATAEAMAAANAEAAAVAQACGPNSQLHSGALITMNHPW